MKKITEEQIVRLTKLLECIDILGLGIVQDVLAKELLRRGREIREGEDLKEVEKKYKNVVKRTKNKEVAGSWRNVENGDSRLGKK